MCSVELFGEVAAVNVDCPRPFIRIQLFSAVLPQSTSPPSRHPPLFPCPFSPPLRPPLRPPVRSPSPPSSPPPFSLEQALSSHAWTARWVRSQTRRGNHSAPTMYARGGYSSTNQNKPCVENSTTAARQTPPIVASHVRRVTSGAAQFGSLR
jgi:hypothetical protein